MRIEVKDAERNELDSYMINIKSVHKIKTLGYL